MQSYRNSSSSADSKAAPSNPWSCLFFQVKRPLDLRYDSYYFLRLAMPYRDSTSQPDHLRDALYQAQDRDQALNIIRETEPSSNVNHWIIVELDEPHHETLDNFLKTDGTRSYPLFSTFKTIFVYTKNISQSEGYILDQVFEINHEAENSKKAAYKKYDEAIAKALKAEEKRAFEKQVAALYDEAMRIQQQANGSSSPHYINHNLLVDDFRLPSSPPPPFLPPPPMSARTRNVMSHFKAQIAQQKQNHNSSAVVKSVDLSSLSCTVPVPAAPSKSASSTLSNRTRSLMAQVKSQKTGNSNYKLAVIPGLFGSSTTITEAGAGGPPPPSTNNGNSNQPR